MLALAYAPDCGAVLACSRCSLSIWDLVRSAKYLDLRCPGILQAVEYAACSRAAVTGARDGSISVISVRTGRRLREMACGSAVVALAYLADMRAVAAGEEAGAVVTLWDVDSGLSVQRLWCDGTVHALAALVTPPLVADVAGRLGTAQPSSEHGTLGHAVVSGDAACCVHVWDVETGKRRRTLPCHGEVTSLACDGEAGLVASGELGGRLTLWDLETGEQRWIVNDRLVWCLVFASDSEILVAGDGHKLTVWHLRSNRRWRETRAGHPVRALAYAGDRGAILAGDDCGQVIAWPVSSLM